MFRPHPSAIAAIALLAGFLTFTLARAGADPESAGKSSTPASAGTSEAAEAALLSSVENSVVKVFSTSRDPDSSRPWTKQAPEESTGSGVVISGKRILTNAHVVLYSSQVQIQANQSGDKLSATVEAIAPGIDLAVLKLDDESFFDTHPPLAQAKILPEVKDAVMAYGYPTGGNSLSITRGIVSRIEFTTYNPPIYGLRIQIDAAINPGNSGGPAIVGDKMIGLAFQQLGGAQNIGYIIPCEEIDLFLKDLADGHYDGKPSIFDEFQTLENPALRSFLKLDKGVQGIVVHRPDSTDPNYPLKEWDVITRIGNMPVDNQGTIKLGPKLRINFLYEVQRSVKNGKVPMQIVRDGKEMSVQVPVATTRPLVVATLDADYPSYFVYGPLVFSNANNYFVGDMLRGENAIKAVRWWTYAGSLLLARRGDKPAFEGEELVVVSSPFFPHKLAKGYSNPSRLVVKAINGKPVKNLAHLVAILRDATDEFLVFSFDQREAETMVFRRTEMLGATEEILNDNGVRKQGSPDVLAVWNAKSS